MNAAPVRLAVVFATALALSSPAQGAADDHRHLETFRYDAAVVENVWIEGQFRWQDLSGSADAVRLGPVLAFSPRDGLEVGGSLDIIDLDLGARSESGLGDTTVYGKWQFFHNPIQFSVGAEISLPTGDEEKLLGSGEFDLAVFAAVRKNLAEAYVSGFFGIRRNGDATVGSNLGPALGLNGETSIFLGGGVIFPMQRNLSLGLEMEVETERYRQADSMVQVTGTLNWKPNENLTLRGGLGVGLDHGSAPISGGAPDWELIFGAAWHF